MVDDATAQCIEACLEMASAAADAASHCLRWGGAHAEPARVNSLVTCSAVARMIAERLENDDVEDDGLIALGIDVCVGAARVCTELGDPELRPCELAASFAVSALRAVQAQER